MSIQEYVKLALACFVQHFPECRPGGILSSVTLINKFTVDLPAGTLDIFSQLSQLHINCLAFGANSGIDSHVFFLFHIFFSNQLRGCV